MQNARSSKFANIDDALYDLFKEKWANNVLVNDPISTQKALDLAVLLNEI